MPIVIMWESSDSNATSEGGGLLRTAIHKSNAKVGLTRPNGLWPHLARYCHDMWMVPVQVLVARLYATLLGQGPTLMRLALHAYLLPKVSVDAVGHIAHG